MSAVPKTLLTPEEYLARERRAEFKSEYYRGEMFAMAGALYPHNAIKDNLIGELQARFKGGPCRTLSSDQRVKVDLTGLYTYPDIVVLCEPPQFDDKIRDTLLNPQIILEILSESTEAYDRGAKFRHYQRIPSLKEYVLVSQDEAVIERYVRQPDGDWLLTTFADPAGEFSLATVPARMLLADVYRGVTLPESPPR